ncbi:hypothetical protein EJB05_35308, partial [Eragrostis curvula]
MVLLNAWKEMFEQRRKGEFAPWHPEIEREEVRNHRRLVAEDWRALAIMVNAHRTEKGLRYHRTNKQCENRMGVLRELYKKELSGSAARPLPGTIFSVLHQAWAPAGQAGEAEQQLQQEEEGVTRQRTLRDIYAEPVEEGHGEAAVGDLAPEQLHVQDDGAEEEDRISAPVPRRRRTTSAAPPMADLHRAMAAGSVDAAVTLALMDDYKSIRMKELDIEAAKGTGTGPSANN